MGIYPLLYETLHAIYMPSPHRNHTNFKIQYYSVTTTVGPEGVQCTGILKSYGQQIDTETKGSTNSIETHRPQAEAP